MQIVIHCAGLSFNADTIKTGSLGGSESAAIYVANEFAEEGHSVTLFTTITERSKISGVVYQPLGKQSEEHPLGDAFDSYALRTPHDVLIIQRHPAAFTKRYASKSNYLWLHDMPNPQYKPMLTPTMPNVDGVFVVSEYHKAEVVKTWGLDPAIVHNIQNGVDLKLYEGPTEAVDMDFIETHMHPSNGIPLLYSSRPERGLVNLVAPNGVMDMLYGDATTHGKYHLYVCSYEHIVPDMADYYAQLEAMCWERPDVTMLGHLSKGRLAAVQRFASMAVYPTQYKETSCITAIEAQAAGLPFISSNVGALAETTKKSGSVLINLTKEGDVDIKKFVGLIRSMTDTTLAGLKRAQLKAANQCKEWAHVMVRMVDVIDADFDSVSPAAKAKFLMETSDIFALRKHLQNVEDDAELNNITWHMLKEMRQYKFIDSDDLMAQHYIDYYQSEKSKGHIYGPESLAGNQRFEYTVHLIKKAIADRDEPITSIMDYGCAHGHYTINLASMFPDIEFVGVDISESNLKIAKQWAKDEDLMNVKFVHGQVDPEHGDLKMMTGGVVVYNSFDIVLACEVLEHVVDYQAHIDILRTYLCEAGRFIMSTPYGPWESLSFEASHPYRTHIHHFDHANLKTMFKGFDNVGIANIPAGSQDTAMKLGCYVTDMDKNSDHKCGCYKNSEKIFLAKGRETVSVCMLVNDETETLLAALNSIAGIADELVIRFESQKDSRCVDIAEQFCEDHPYIAPKFSTASAPVSKVGFDAARNDTIDIACGDWVMVIDADEVLSETTPIRINTKHSQIQAFAIEQVHFSISPAGVTAKDRPVRLFRRGKGIRFHGVVHEHPSVSLNNGIPHTLGVSGTTLAHYGYTDDVTRKSRFERNLPLMRRDRLLYPNRHIGRFLWIRDLAHLNQDDAAKYGETTEEMRGRSVEGIRLWRELIKVGMMKYAIDSMPYIAELNDCLYDGKTFDFSMALAVGWISEAPKGKLVESRFGQASDMKLYMDGMLKAHIKWSKE